ncbi:MAG: hypothetical protein K8F62_09960 [Pseudorhodoplanes sp.]|nr:hypothetical protein [Pseudorhodoplanes sp.]
MRLTDALVERTVNQCGAQAIPQTHPAVPQLNEMFGDHTFFLDDSGLLIVEPTESPRRGMWAGKVVKLASWSDADRTGLAPHRPEPTDVVIVMATEH